MKKLGEVEVEGISAREQNEIRSNRDKRVQSHINNQSQ